MRTIRVIVVLVLLLTWQRAWSASVRWATVEVAAWTAIGDRIEKISVVLTPVTGGQDFKASGRLAKLSVPTGDYIMRVDAEAFRTRRQLMHVYQPVVFQTVSLRIAQVEASPPGSSLVKGSVRNYDGDFQELRVRLMPLYGAEVRESVPDKHGLFELVAENGFYLIVTVVDLARGGVAILDTKPVQIRDDTVITIDLQGKRPERVLSPAH
jgi:hypothetical protein